MGIEAPARLEREYINTIEGIGMTCLYVLNSGAVKTAHLQYTDSSEVRERASGRHLERIYSSKSTLDSLLVLIMQKENTLSKQLEERLRLVNVCIPLWAWVDKRELDNVGKSVF